MNDSTRNNGKRRVVIVNDDVTQLKTLAGILRKQGLEAVEFDSAESALIAMGRESPPDLIITDLYMPGIDGWRFCRLLRSAEYSKLNKVPIVIVSHTFTGDEAEKIARDLGAEAFLPAPVSGKVLVEKLEAIFRGEKPSRVPRLLVVEDSRTQAAIIREAFVSRGYSVDISASLAEARKSFLVQGYDMVVIDYHLPDGEGDTLLEEFREVRLDCVCVMITSDPKPELALTWIKRGASAYLRKPFEPIYLVELCEKARRERALMHVEDLLEARTKELRESEARLQLAVRGASLGVWDFDMKTGRGACNERWSQMFGFGLDELGPSFEAWFNRLHPEDRPSALEQWNAHLQGTSEEYRQEVRLRHKTGDWVWVLCTGRVTERDPKGEPLRACGTNLDITENKTAACERERLQTELAQAQKMESIGRLAGGVAHDFNNMLSVILGHSELCMEQVQEGSELKEDLREIHAAAERSAELTRQLLAFARKQRITPVMLEVDRTVSGMLKMLRRLIGEDKELLWLPGAEGARVEFDPAQLDQVLANLCVNARDAISGLGKVCIESSLVTLSLQRFVRGVTLSPGRYVQITVSDDGEGMDPEIVSRAFEPFFTTKEAGKGTGLGLATVYGIVTQNRGAIDVRSERGLGTTFEILLPHQTEARQNINASSCPGAPIEGKETVLIVEDEPALLRLTSSILGRLGYLVLSASGPAQALRIAREHCGDIHLLLSDVVMPEMNGVELSTLMLSIRPGIKRLFMSGYAADILARQGMSENEVQLVSKPFTIETLAQKLRAALQS